MEASKPEQVAQRFCRHWNAENLTASSLPRGMHTIYTNVNCPTWCSLCPSQLLRVLLPPTVMPKYHFVFMWCVWGWKIITLEEEPWYEKQHNFPKATWPKPLMLESQCQGSCLVPSSHLAPAPGTSHELPLSLTYGLGLPLSAFISRPLLLSQCAQNCVCTWQVLNNWKFSFTE